MRLTERVHQLLSEHLKEGNLAIDATAGNGYDTCFLADQVGPYGRVIAIDIQASAIESTRQKVVATQLEERVSLLVGDHALQLAALIGLHRAGVAAIVFNLGYLPGSDKTVQTSSKKTLAALDASIQLLVHGGLLCVTAYRGHPGGLEEAQCVENWMHTRQLEGHAVESHVPPSLNQPPILWLLRKQ